MTTRFLRVAGTEKAGVFMKRRKLSRLARQAALASAFGIAAGTAPAAAQTIHTCSAWNVERSIEVQTPGDDGTLCQVLYRKPDENAADQILWRSSQSLAFCNDKAEALAARLAAAGFECRENAAPLDSNAARRVPLDQADSDAAAQAVSSQEDRPTMPAAPSSISGGRPYQRLSGGTDTKWHLAGYADATFIAVSREGDTSTSFAAARFNPAFHFQYKDLVLLEAESEISVDDEGETEFELEYAQADLFVHDNVTIVLGQFLSPVGQFQERLHPTWINRMADPPPGFGHDGVQPTSELGVMLRGGVSFGGVIATYSAAVGNGPMINSEGSVMFEAKAGDDNSNKAVSGRFGLLPLPYLEVGGSFLRGKVSGMAMPDEIGGLAPTSADVALWGADAAYTRGPWDVRAEYLNAKRDPINSLSDETSMVEALPELELEAWYGQVAYSLSELTDHKILQRFEPAVRYGEYRVMGLEELAEEVAEKRLSIGLNYWLAPSIVARAVVELRDFTAREDDDPESSETRILAQFAYGF